MKRTIFVVKLLCAALLFGALAQTTKAETPSRQTQTQFELLLFDRCFRSIGLEKLHLGIPFRVSYCKNAVRDLWKSLDLVQPIVSDAKHGDLRTANFVAFHEELVELLNDYDFHSFLEDLHFQIQIDKGLLNIWELALRHASHEVHALQWLAVGFQDTSPHQLHLRWLRSNGHCQGSYLEQICRLWEESTTPLTSRQYQRNYGIELYPNEVLLSSIEGLNRKIYHFYVPAYLTYKMTLNGRPQSSAARISFLFNYQYELLTLKEGVQIPLIELGSMFDKDTLKDIYAGYLGAQIDLKRMTVNNFLTFTELSEKLTRLLPQYEINRLKFD